MAVEIGEWLRPLAKNNEIKIYGTWWCLPCKEKTWRFSSLD
jgi:hypothetical protein